MGALGNHSCKFERNRRGRRFSWVFNFSALVARRVDVPLRYFTCVIRTPQAMFPASLSEIAGVAESVFESEYVCVAVIMDITHCTFIRLPRILKIWPPAISTIVFQMISTFLLHSIQKSYNSDAESHWWNYLARPIALSYY